MAMTKPGSSNENYSKGQGKGGKPLQGDMGAEYGSGYNDKEAEKQAGIRKKAFDDQMSGKSTTG